MQQSEGVALSRRGKGGGGGGQGRVDVEDGGHLLDDVVVDPLGDHVAGHPDGVLDGVGVRAAVADDRHPVDAEHGDPASGAAGPAAHRACTSCHAVPASPSHANNTVDMTWGGLANSYYWIDPAKKVTGVWATQLLPFYPDLTHPQFESALALVHQRYSMNRSSGRSRTGFFRRSWAIRVSPGARVSPSRRIIWAGTS